MLFKKRNYDKLTVTVVANVSKKYMNVSKHKRVLAPEIHESVYLFVNEAKINEDSDEVFVISEFFNSLAADGRFPMFTCSCGIFGCGGFYIDVHHKKNSVTWVTEQSTDKKHLFTSDNIRFVAEELIRKLSEVNDLRIKNNLNANYDIQIFTSQLELFTQQTRR
ncbi:hypothetical protein [Cohnella hashimotonis]|uniref:Uncharacterized protein n=1 Tax=Cohnella hashimotonis TaxID=2826895 RepID=A0ABT6TBY6_9BACL|nr:hypothetical protein [Cohnella hashimotonis]MDI4644279.1 hypothetical protein [Cohnella hashimotonis]